MWCIHYSYILRIIFLYYLYAIIFMCWFYSRQTGRGVDGRAESHDLDRIHPTFISMSISIFVSFGIVHSRGAVLNTANTALTPPQRRQWFYLYLHLYQYPYVYPYIQIITEFLHLYPYIPISIFLYDINIYIYAHIFYLHFLCDRM